MAGELLKRLEAVLFRKSPMAEAMARIRIKQKAASFGRDYGWKWDGSKWVKVRLG